MIKAEILNQKIKLNCESVASDSVKFLKIKFLLDDIWDDAFKTVVFNNEELNISAAVIMEDGNELYLGDNTCLVPFEVIKPPCFSVSISGIKNDSVITTLPESIKVYQSGAISAEEPDNYTPSQYEQLMQVCNETKNIAESVREDADNGVFNGKNGEDGKDAITEQKYNPDSEWAQSGKAVAEAIKTAPNFIKQTAIGNPIVVNDVSPIEHKLDVEVKSKNLLPYPYTAELPQTIDGITFTDNGDGSIKVKGSTNQGVTLTIATLKLSAGTYHVADEISGDGKGEVATFLTYTHLSRITLTEETQVPVIILVMGSSEYPATVNVVVKPMVYKYEGTQESYVSQILEGVTVSRYGKNLFPSSEIGLGYYNDSAGNRISNNTKLWVDLFPCKPNTTYTISSNLEIYSIWQKDEAKVTISNTRKGTNNNNKKVLSVTTTSNCHYLAVSLNNIDGVNDTSAFEWLQTEVGTVATEYEPYKQPQTATANADGTVEGLTSISPNMTLFADNGLIIECDYNTDTKTYIDNKFAELKAMI